VVIGGAPGDACPLGHIHPELISFQYHP
jgi:hypothetical protein